MLLDGALLDRSLYYVHLFYVVWKVFSVAVLSFELLFLSKQMILDEAVHWYDIFVTLSSRAFPVTLVII